jgi:hypothetical protein
MSNVVDASSRFIKPAPKVELQGRLGLTLHEVAESLGITFSHAKQKLENREFIDEISRVGELVPGIDMTVIAMATQHEIQEDTGHKYSRDVRSYALSTDAAKFFVAKYDNEIGRTYLGFLIKQEKEWQIVQENLENPKMARAFAKALLDRADAQEAYEKVAAKCAHLNRCLTTSQVRNGSVTKENNKLKGQIQDLKDTLGDGENYKSVLAGLKMFPELAGIDPSSLGKKLKKVSAEFGLKTISVPDSRYGSVNAYHHRAWKVIVEAVAA